MALCLVLLCAIPLTASAANEIPELSVSCVRVNETTAKVTVSIVNNPGIMGFDIDLKMNSCKKYLAFSTLSRGSAFGDTDRYYFTDNHTAAITDECLTVVCAGNEIVTGDTELFTAFFTVKANNFGNLLFLAEGAVCTGDMKKVTVENDGWEALFGDKMDVRFLEPMLQLNGGRITGTSAIRILSYDSGQSLGIGYAGDAKAILTCYYGGKFVGCRIKDITIENNKFNDFLIENVSFPCADEDEIMLILLLTDASYKPIMSERCGVQFRIS